jgi:cysteinyl-tRNA synthetase
MGIIIDIREQYREDKAWEEADALRNRLAELGVAVDDRPEGTVWRLEPTSR